MRSLLYIKIILGDFQWSTNGYYTASPKLKHSMLHSPLSHLMQYPVIIGLSDAEELAVVDERLHDALVEELVRGGRDAEGVAHVQQLHVAFGTRHFHAPIENHAPRVQFLAVVHHRRARLFHVREHHAGAQSSTHGQSHVGEGLLCGGVLGREGKSFVCIFSFLFWSL